MKKKLAVPDLELLVYVGPHHGLFLRKFQKEFLPTSGTHWFQNLTPK